MNRKLKELNSLQGQRTRVLRSDAICVAGAHTSLRSDNQPAVRKISRTVKEEGLFYYFFMFSPADVGLYVLSNNSAYLLRITVKKGVIGIMRFIIILLCDA
jgi:hypothetical protein